MGFTAWFRECDYCAHLTKLKPGTEGGYPGTKCLVSTWPCEYVLYRTPGSGVKAEVEEKRAKLGELRFSPSYLVRSLAWGYVSLSFREEGR